MRRALFIVLSAVVLATSVNAQTKPAECALKFKAALDISMDDTGRVTVPVTFNGTAKQMMVDTGASDSVLTAKAASDLQLKPRGAGGGRSLEGFGGYRTDRVVDVAEFGFGRMKGKDFSFFIDNGYMESAGLLGGDFLFFFDLDFDFAAAKLNLISPDHCPGQVVYWTHQPHGEVPFEIEGNQIALKVQLDGQEVSAILDTGAVDTVMSLEKASEAFDLDEVALAKSRHYPFKTLTFGEVQVNAPAIRLVPDDESVVMGHQRRSLHMIVGMGVLRRLHLYISYKEKKIYVTPATQY